MTRTLKERTFSGTTNPEIQPWETEHRKLARLAAAEGIVLLKNEEHVLPLKAGSAVAIYGAGAGKTIKGGTGSGDVNEREKVSICQGMIRHVRTGRMTFFPEQGTVQIQWISFLFTVQHHLSCRQVIRSGNRQKAKM